MPAFAEEEAAADLSGDLVIWEGTSERGACAEAYIEVLSEQYPNLNITYEAKPEDTLYTALSTAFQSGNGPDIYWTCGTKNSIFESKGGSRQCAGTDGLSWTCLCLKRTASRQW